VSTAYRNQCIWDWLEGHRHVGWHIRVLGLTAVCFIKNILKLSGIKRHYPTLSGTRRHFLVWMREVHALPVPRSTRALACCHPAPSPVAPVARSISQKPEWLAGACVLPGTENSCASSASGRAVSHIPSERFFSSSPHLSISYCNFHGLILPNA
jgi:hypothetical protein